MTDALIDSLLLTGAVTFAGAFVLSVRNYWTTRGITRYWLLIAAVALLGTAWAGSITVETVFNVHGTVAQNVQLPLIITAAAGYAASLVNAVADDVVSMVV